MKPGQLAIVVLAGGCALLALSWVLLLGGVGQQIPPAEPLERSDWIGAGGIEDDEFALPPLETYAEVTARPLFNEDRKPTPPGSQDPGPDDGDNGDQDPVELNVTVTGIIITPEKKVAMVVDNATKEPLRLSEGMPLEGEQSAWTLTSIQPRKLVFDGGATGPQEVALETYTQALKGGAPTRARATQVAVQAQATEEQTEVSQSPTEDDRAARAEEIRRRVAERRAQLREEAARRREEQQQENDNE